MTDHEHPHEHPDTGSDDMSFDQDFWDQHWQERAGDPGSAAGQPLHPYLAREIGGLEPGTALEAGCGAGAEAIWLAAHGWRVTAADISSAALAQARARAEGTPAAERLSWVEADLSTWVPDCLFDLVTTHYAHPAIPQLDFYSRIGEWVAPGGTLLVVGHLHSPDTTGHGHHPPAKASTDAAGITARLDATEWEVVTAEETERTIPGHDEQGPLRDVVLRATRRR